MNFAAGRSVLTRKNKVRRRNRKSDEDDSSPPEPAVNHRVIQVASVSSRVENTYSSYDIDLSDRGYGVDNSADDSVVNQPLNPRTIWHQKARRLGLYPYNNISGEILQLQ